eukprot:ANDGO_05653.mRNA.1 Ribonuclease 3
MYSGGSGGGGGSSYGGYAASPSQTHKLHVYRTSFGTSAQLQIPLRDKFLRPHSSSYITGFCIVSHSPAFHVSDYALAPICHPEALEYPCSVTVDPCLVEGVLPQTTFRRCPWIRAHVDDAELESVVLTRDEVQVLVDFHNAWFVKLLSCSTGAHRLVSQHPLFMSVESASPFIGKPVVCPLVDGKLNVPAMAVLLGKGTEVSISRVARAFHPSQTVQSLSSQDAFSANDVDELASMHRILSQQEWTAFESVVRSCVLVPGRDTRSVYICKRFPDREHVSLSIGTTVVTPTPTLSSTSMSTSSITKTPVSTLNATQSREFHDHMDRVYVIPFPVELFKFSRALASILSRCTRSIHHFEAIQKQALSPFRIRFRDSNRYLLRRAFTHKSFISPSDRLLSADPMPGHQLERDYEQLEFLGDALLQLVLSDRVARLYQYLTSVKRERISDSFFYRWFKFYARNSTIEKAMITKFGWNPSTLLTIRGNHDDSRAVISDCFEAFLAAVFLDSGLAMDRVVYIVDNALLFSMDCDIVTDDRFRLDSTVWRSALADNRQSSMNVSIASSKMHSYLGSSSVTVDSLRPFLGETLMNRLSPTDAESLRPLLVECLAFNLPCYPHEKRTNDCLNDVRRAVLDPGDPVVPASFLRFRLVGQSLLRLSTVLWLFLGAFRGPIQAFANSGGSWADDESQVSEKTYIANRMYFYSHELRAKLNAALTEHRMWDHVTRTEDSYALFGKEWKQKFPAASSRNLSHLSGSQYEALYFCILAVWGGFFMHYDGVSDVANPVLSFSSATKQPACSVCNMPHSNLFACFMCKFFFSQRQGWAMALDYSESASKHATHILTQRFLPLGTIRGTTTNPVSRPSSYGFRQNSEHSSFKSQVWIDGHEIASAEDVHPLQCERLAVQRGYAILTFLRRLAYREYGRSSTRESTGLSANPHDVHDVPLFDSEEGGSSEDEGAEDAYARVMKHGQFEFDETREEGFYANTAVVGPIWKIWKQHRDVSNAQARFRFSRRQTRRVIENLETEESAEFDLRGFKDGQAHVAIREVLLNRLLNDIVPFVNEKRLFERPNAYAWSLRDFLAWCSHRKAAAKPSVAAATAQPAARQNASVLAPTVVEDNGMYSDSD